MAYGRISKDLEPSPETPSHDAWLPRFLDRTCRYGAVPGTDRCGKALATGVPGRRQVLRGLAWPALTFSEVFGHEVSPHDVEGSVLRASLSASTNSQA